MVRRQFSQLISENLAVENDGLTRQWAKFWAGQSRERISRKGLCSLRIRDAKTSAAFATASRVFFFVLLPLQRRVGALRCSKWIKSINAHASVTLTTRPSSS